MDQKKILLVDDSSLFLRIQESFLDRQGISSITASSGIEAMEKAAAHDPDLILLDLYMKDINGDEVCSRLRSMEKFRAVPILIVTAETDDHIFKSCLAAGCDGFIIKPFKKDQFLSKIREHLGIKERLFRRVPAIIPCTIVTGKTTLATLITNLSEGGAFVKLSPPVKPGTTIEIRFPLPGQENLIAGKAIVRWVSETSENIGFGAEFLSLSDRNRMSITEFIASVRD